MTDITPPPSPQGVVLSLAASLSASLARRHLPSEACGQPDPIMNELAWLTNMETIFTSIAVLSVCILKDDDS
jgi:hypothetical protein